MIAERELNLMKEAYGTMYEIENRLRSFAVSRMEKDFGINWRMKASRMVNNSCTKTKLEELNYHQLVSYYRMFPNLSSILPSNVFLQLFNLASVRNKIAHNHLITMNELEDLKQVNANITYLLN